MLKALTEKEIKALTIGTKVIVQALHSKYDTKLGGSLYKCKVINNEKYMEFNIKGIMGHDTLFIELFDISEKGEMLFSFSGREFLVYLDS